MGSTVWEVSGYKPLSAVFELLKDNDQVAFLDSSEQGEQGRFSIVGCKPFLTIEQVDGRCLVNGAPADAAFFDVLDAALRTHQEPNETHLPLIGGALGYLGYDFGRALNGVPTCHAPFGESNACGVEGALGVGEVSAAEASGSSGSAAPAVPSASAMPEAQMVFYDVLLIEDHEQQKLYASAQGQTVSADEARVWVDSLVASAVSAPVPSRGSTLAKFTSRFTEQDYQQALDRIVEYMLDGHIYVANMTQQLAMDAPQPPYDLYRYLRTFNPAPFSAYLRGAGFDVCCSSMERFLFVRDGHAVTRPIKGTRPRGKTPDEDARNRDELFASPKDNSELLMICRFRASRARCIRIPSLPWKRIQRCFTWSRPWKGDFAKMRRRSMWCVTLFPVVRLPVRRRFVRWKLSTSWSAVRAVYILAALAIFRMRATAI